MITGARLNGDAYMTELARQVRNTVKDAAGREAILGGIYKVVEETGVLSRDAGDFEVRIVNRGGPARSIHVPPLDRR